MRHRSSSASGGSEGWRKQAPDSIVGNLIIMQSYMMYDYMIESKIKILIMQTCMMQSDMIGSWSWSPDSSIGSASSVPSA